MIKLSTTNLHLQDSWTVVFFSNDNTIGFGSRVDGNDDV
jgi:hypothetical protein